MHLKHTFNFKHEIQYILLNYKFSTNFKLGKQKSILEVSKVECQSYITFKNNIKNFHLLGH